MKQDKEKPETSIPAEEQKTQVSESAKTKEKAPTTEKQKAQPETPKPAPQASLKEVIAKQAIEEEESGSASFTLRKILGGDILTAQIIRKQIWLFMLIVFSSLSTYPTDTASRRTSSNWTNCKKSCKTRNTVHCQPAVR